MMVEPSVNEVMELRDIKSKYSLVIITAKRARDIVTTGVSFSDCNSLKPVSVALNEIYENKVSFRYKDEQEKQNPEFVLFKSDDTIEE